MNSRSQSDDVSGGRANEREREGVPPRVAPFQPQCFRMRMCLHTMMLVRSGAVVMLRMIVIGVGVGVQRGRAGGHHPQRNADHNRGDTLHTSSLWNLS